MISVRPLQMMGGLAALRVLGRTCSRASSTAAATDDMLRFRSHVMKSDRVGSHISHFFRVERCTIND